MSPRRKISLIAAVPLGLAAIVFGLACLPSVQTWAARRVLAGQPDLVGTVGRVAIGWNSVRVTDLTLERGGQKLTLPSLEAELPVLAAARGRIDVARLVARDWTLDLAAADSAPAAQPAASASRPAADITGLFDALRLPAGFSLREADVAGDILLSSGRAKLTLAGGQLTTGRDGRFTFDVNHAATTGDTIAARAELTARLSDSGVFDRLALDLVATATGAQTPDGATLHLLLTSQRAPAGGETHALRLVADKRELAAIDLDWTDAAGAPAGRWRIDLRDADLAPFTLGLALPDFTATGEGALSADTAGLRSEVSGKLILKAGRLEAIDARLAAAGELTLTSDFDLVRTARGLRARRLALELAGSSGPVLSANALQGFALEPSTGKVTAAEPGNDLARVTLTDLPSAWLQPWLPGFTLTGGPARAEWRLALRDGELAVRPVAPLTLAGVDLDRDGAPLLRGVDLSIAAGGGLGADGWRAELIELAVLSGGARVLGITAKAHQPADAALPLTVTGSYESDLRAAATQPFFPRGATVIYGRIQGDFSAAVGDEIRVEAGLAAGGLRTAERAAFPELALTLRAVRDASGAIEAELPLAVITPARRSDAMLKATRDVAGRTVASLTADTVYYEDMQAFAGLAPANEKPVTTPEGPEGDAPAEGPFWGDLNGELTLTIARLVYAPGVEMPNIELALRLGPDGLSLRDLRALVGDNGQLRAAVEIRHDATQELPYALSGGLALSGFDPGPWLRAANPGKPPVLEGEFDVLAPALSGRAADPADLVELALGQVEVMSNGGTLRALGVKVSAATSVTSPAASILGVLGAVSGNPTALKYAEKARAGTNVARLLTDVQFDQLSLRLARDAEHNLVIKDVVFRSPLLRLEGGGSINNKPGLSLLRRPLSLELRLSARDQLATALAALKLLDAEADESGYLPMNQLIKLDGSLESVGTAQLQRLIERALLD